ncbi:MAG: DUF4129 domain-containing protein [Bacillota bacterium]
MMLRRIIALPALLLLLIALPALAAAAPRSIALGEYQAMLRQGVAHLERADQLIKAGKNPEAAREIAASRTFLSGQWRVETPDGTVNGDLSDLDRLLSRAGAGQRPDPKLLGQARDLAREHLAGAEALDRLEPASVPGARATLEKALEQTTARTVLQRFNDWINQLLGRRMDRATDVDLPTSVYVAGGVVALLALIWLGFSLYRNLAGHGAAGEATLRQGREGRPDRPPTPAELRARAQELSVRGEHLEAIRSSHLALLRHFDAIQLIRYVPAQTNREHEWQLRRRHPHLARTLRTLNDLVDDRLYSGHGATAEDFMRVDGLVDQLWREGDAASRSAEATTGASSSA